MNIISKKMVTYDKCVNLPKILHIIPCFRNKLRLYFMHIYFDIIYFRRYIWLYLITMISITISSMFSFLLYFSINNLPLSYYKEKTLDIITCCYNVLYGIRSNT